jgi:lysozyme family protein
MAFSRGRAMKKNWDYCFERVLVYEGGYVDHPSDPGGATNLGITIGTLSRWLGREATKREVKALTAETVKPIYQAYYWGPVRGDLMPSGVDLALFDYAVNSGHGRAIRHFQEVIGVDVDGAIGTQTLGAVEAQDPEFMIRALCERRLRFLQGLGTWAVFGRGWGRRVEDVEDRALTLANGQPHFAGG